MHHDIFGEITYDKDVPGWNGVCRLPVFAEYGKVSPEDYALSEPDRLFLRGEFALLIQDGDGAGPTEPQAAALRFLREHEQQACRTVMLEVLKAYREFTGSWVAWLQARRESRFWGWLAALLGPEYKTPEDLKPAVRCLGVEVSSYFFGAYAYIGFTFETSFGVEADHGFSVIYHPEVETIWGNGSAIHELLPWPAT